MPYIVSFLLAIVSYTVIDNVILSRYFGICSFVGVGNKVKSAVGMGAAVTFVTMMAALVCWPIFNFILVPAGMEYMETIVFILVIASLVQMVGYFIKKTSPSLYKTLGIYLPLITTNCAVLGVVETNMTYDFGRSMANALGTSLGFVLVIFLFACIRVKLEGNDLPKAFKGVPIALIVAGIMAIVFMGLGGMVDLGSWGIA
ncbi:MAG: Rnf-Nqr domain containing protein [Mollicutes bacterium]|nr:Rnf-Nqr domain containing protein [Mollicutes bacterium]MDD7063721.1 Rnf-Nqr domain containing protein [Mollicutes bacterium]MDY5298037.1 Rnf-Nqr domain containing protein [Candidatus Enteromonas sp.]